MPSRRHELLAFAIPRVRRSRELDSPERERARLERWHARLDPGLPSRSVRALRRHHAVVTDDRPFPVHTITRRGTTPRTHLYYVHGGGFVSPADPVHVRYAVRLARALDADVVLPDYPLAPEHTWSDSHEPMADHLAELLATGDRVVVAGDSAGGGIALALAETIRDRAGRQPSHLLLHSPWVDLTTSTPETFELDAVDPWLFIGKLQAYAAWWAGSPEHLARPEVSPALGELAGLPPTLMMCGTRDVLVPGCRLLADRAAVAGWPLTYLEAPDLLHVFPLLPGIPEAARAWRHTVDFLR